MKKESVWISLGIVLLMYQLWVSYTYNSELKFTNNRLTIITKQRDSIVGELKKSDKLVVACKDFLKAVTEGNIKLKNKTNVKTESIKGDSNAPR